MLKDKQTVMGFKTYEKEATQNKHVNAKTKQTKKLRFLGKDLRTHDLACAHRLNSCVRRPVLACMMSLPRNPNFLFVFFFLHSHVCFV